MLVSNHLPYDIIVCEDDPLDISLVEIAYGIYFQGTSA